MKKLLILQIFFVCPLLFSQDYAPQPEYPIEVIETYGKPKDKIEQEALRKEIWIYPEMEVVFHEGRVETIHDLSMDSSALNITFHTEEATDFGKDKVITDVLNELKEKTDEKTTKNPKGKAGKGPIPRNLITRK